MQYIRLSGSENEQFIGVRASDNEIVESENEDYPLRATEMKELRHPVKPILQTFST